MYAYSAQQKKCQEIKQPWHSQTQDDIQRPQIELIALPQEDEGTHDIAHGKERHSVGATQEHDSEGDPVGGEEDNNLHHVQVVPAGSMDWMVDMYKTSLHKRFHGILLLAPIRYEC